MSSLYSTSYADCGIKVSWQKLALFANTVYHVTNVAINFLSPLQKTHIENTNNQPPSSENRRFICCV
jgi:hypothetical protein